MNFYTNFKTKLSQNLRHFVSMEEVGITCEKIVIQYFTDSQQQIRINETMGKQVIHVLARIIQLRSQPSDGSSLSFEFFFNKVSNMWCFLRGHSVDFKHRKSVELFLA